MYKTKLIFESQLFQSGLTIPQDDTVVCTTAHRMGGTFNRLAITVTAKTLVSIADTKVFTIALQEASTEAGVFAAPASNPKVEITMAGAGVYNAGEHIGSLIVPAFIAENGQAGALEKWIKAVIVTDDAACTGTLEVFIEYLT